MVIRTIVKLFKLFVFSKFKNTLLVLCKLWISHNCKKKEKNSTIYANEFDWSWLWRCNPDVGAFETVKNVAEVTRNHKRWIIRKTSIFLNHIFWLNNDKLTNWDDKFQITLPVIGKMCSYVVFKKMSFETRWDRLYQLYNHTQCRGKPRMKALVKIT